MSLGVGLLIAKTCFFFVFVFLFFVFLSCENSSILVNENKICNSLFLMTQVHQKTF